MPPKNPLRNCGQVLFHGLCTASGILAPALAMGDLTPEKFVLGLGAGVLTVLGSWRMSAEVQQAADTARQQLPETDLLLRNHDLNLLVVEALRRAIEGAAETKGLAAHHKLIRSLAAQIEAHFQQVGKLNIAGQGQTDLPNLAVHLAQHGHTQSQPPQLELETWRNLLDDLAASVKNPAGLPEIRDGLAAHVQAHFDRLVIAILREDASGQGPTQGRGWAALTLLVWTRFSADLRTLKEYAASSDELTAMLFATQQRADAKLDELLRWLGPLAAEHKELSDYLRAAHHDLATRLDDIQELIGHGLLSPEEFRLHYWRNRRNDPGLELLWQDPDRAQILTTEIVGRAAEVAEFGRFLDPANRSVRVRFWKGYPGTGKSRLMIEFARHATEAGCRVFFVDPAVHDLMAALKRIRPGPPVVLLWDDYKGDKSEELRTFLDLDAPPCDRLGPTVKRVITGWPSHNVLGEKARDARYVEAELRPIVPSDELVGYTSRLLSSVAVRQRTEVAQTIVEGTESQPEAVLRAVRLVIEGKPVGQIDFVNLLENEYDDLIRYRLLAERNQEDCDGVRKALVVMSLLGSVDLGDGEQRSALEAAGVKEHCLGVLADKRTVSRNGGVYSISLDTFRRHVVRRAMDYRRPEVISGSPEGLARLAAPLLLGWFDTIWRICVLAAANTGLGDEIRTRILGVLDSILAGGLSDQAALQLASRLFAATPVEPIPCWRGALADKIGKVRNRRDNARIALEHANALYNATVGELDPLRCRALADAIGKVRQAYNTPEIALAQAMALFNSTVGELDPTRRGELAEAIRNLWMEHKAHEIAIELAKALCNASWLESDALRRAGLAIEIGRVRRVLERQGYRNPEIALAEARALANASVAEPDSRKRAELAGKIGKVRQKYNTPEIATQEAGALFNATITERNARLCRKFARAIGKVRKVHDTLEIARSQAKAIYNASVVEQDPVRRAILKNQIRKLDAQYGSQLSEQ